MGLDIVPLPSSKECSGLPAHMYNLAKVVAFHILKVRIEMKTRPENETSSPVGCISMNI